MRTATAPKGLQHSARKGDHYEHDGSWEAADTNSFSPTLLTAITANSCIQSIDPSLYPSSVIIVIFLSSLSNHYHHCHLNIHIINNIIIFVINNIIIITFLFIFSLIFILIVILIIDHCSVIMIILVIILSYLSSFCAAGVPQQSLCAFFWCFLLVLVFWLAVFSKHLAQILEALRSVHGDVRWQRATDADLRFVRSNCCGKSRTVEEWYVPTLVVVVQWRYLVGGVLIVFRGLFWWLCFALYH